MKYLSDYANEGISKALAYYGAFFAFSTDQFNAQKKPNTEYASLPSGMVCPVDNVSALMAELEANYHAAIAKDIEENGLTNIVIRELNNYECFYTGDIEDAVDALADYPVTFDMILATFKAINRSENPPVICNLCGNAEFEHRMCELPNSNEIVEHSTCKSCRSVTM